ncbi:MAG: CPBP family intramembrane metalloprotease [Acidobacteria bacterium]|nr:CPBP family intramembrane metalloprotease [Acidobacteriota bacterium]
MLALVQSYLWLWSGLIPRGIYLVSAGVLGIAIAGALTRRERAREIGARFDNLARALSEAGIVTIAAAAGLLVAGGWLGTIRPDWAVTVSRLPWLVVWGFLQQFVLQSFVHRRVNEIVRGNAARELATAAIFALCHLPNWRLMIATFTGGWIWSILYRRNPNLFALAAAHAVSSAALSIGFGPALLHGMKVGRGYVTYVPPAP